MTGGGMGQGGPGWMWLVGLVLMTGAVLLVVLAVRAVGGRGDRTRRAPARSGGVPVRGRSRAQQILDERYAAGEIGGQEYRDRLRELGHPER